MEKTLKHSLTYVVSMLVILGVVAGYFFLKMGESLHAGLDHENTLRKENQELIAQAKQLRSRISEFEINVSELETTLAQKQATLADIQSGTAASDAQAQCDSTPSAMITTLQNQLKDTQRKERACATVLTEKDEAIAALELDAQNVSVARDELRSATREIKALRDDLTQTRQENERLLRARAVADSNEDAARENVRASQHLETELAQANQNIAQLEARVLQLQAENDELAAASRASGRLEMVGFQATPNVCNTEFAAGGICLSSIDITATFNFSPNGFIAMVIVDPSGDTIGRESIAGRAVNNVSFELDEEQPSLEGEYYIEFKIKDVFHRFSSKQRFMITRS